MKIILMVIGKTDKEYIKEAISIYEKRLEHYIPYEKIILPDIKNTKKLTEQQQKEQEGEIIKKALRKGDYIILLDEKGKEYTSLQFAKYVEEKMQNPAKRIIFLIGGPYGFSPEIYALATEKISLSKMTFSHQMIRMIFVEQLYRAMTILNNEPYHHE